VSACQMDKEQIHRSIGLIISNRTGAGINWTAGQKPMFTN
jgi:hypothetical protein